MSNIGRLELVLGQTSIRLIIITILIIVVVIIITIIIVVAVAHFIFQFVHFHIQQIHLAKIQIRIVKCMYRYFIIVVVFISYSEEKFQIQVCTLKPTLKSSFFLAEGMVFQYRLCRSITG